MEQMCKIRTISPALKYYVIILFSIFLLNIFVTMSQIFSSDVFVVVKASSHCFCHELNQTLKNISAFFNVFTSSMNKKKMNLFFCSLENRYFSKRNVQTRKIKFGTLFRFPCEGLLFTQGFLLCFYLYIYLLIYLFL